MTGFEANMLIRNITFTLPDIKNKKTLPMQCSPLQKIAKDTVSFSGRIEMTPQQKLERTLDIVECFSDKQIYNMDDFDRKHLEGIQYGLKTFEGMSFSEVYFLLSNMGEFTVPVVRDCAGMCPVCNVNGRPSQGDDRALLRTMDFEDFKNLTDDIKKISKRLNFDCHAKSVAKAKRDSGYNGFFIEPSASLFYDADCKDVCIKDKDGNVHEFPELNKMLFEATGIKGLFDTAGWSRHNTKMQKRMEAVADYYSDPDNLKEIDQLNISLNTYHGLLEKANEYKKNGDKEGYERLQNIYAANIANAMYTFTPLVDTGVYQVLRKCVSDDKDKRFDDYKPEVLDEITKKVFDKLWDRYEEDLKNKNYKFVSNEKKIGALLERHMYAFSPILTTLGPAGRENIFKGFNKEKYNFLANNKNANCNDVLSRKMSSVMVDLNGKIYLIDDIEVFSTDLQLNFKNKDKKTKQIYPVPDQRTLHVKDKTLT